MAQKDDDKGTYGGAGARFSLNVSAVRVLGLEIGRFGDEHDQAGRYTRDQSRVAR